MTAIEVRTERPLALAPDGGQLDLQRLFEQTLAQGAGSVEALGKLVDLHERMQRRSAELEFSRALVEFQATCPAIPRSSTANIATKSGGTFSYTYADLEQIVETIRPHLAAHGLSFTFDSVADGKALKCACTLRHANGHSITAGFALPTDSASAMSEQQKVGAALTFAKRQALVAVLGLTLTDPDPEGEANPSTLTKEQATALEALLAETGSDVEKFKKHFGIKFIADLRQTHYPEAVRMVERKRKASS